MDDFWLPAAKKAPTQDERRTRSSSPVKNRKSLPADFHDEDNDIWSLNSAPVPEYIKSLSSSPFAKKLHISTTATQGKYVIPIPFTLQLPPKLSSANQSLNNSNINTPVRTPVSSRAVSPIRNSPTRDNNHNKSLTPKSIRLVYTGNGYEKLETSESEESQLLGDSFDEDQLKEKIKIPARPKGFIRQHAADELSIINEGSETSRQSTIKAKNDDEDDKKVKMDTKSLPPTPMGSEYAQSLGPPATISPRHERSSTDELHQFEPPRDLNNIFYQSGYAQHPVPGRSIASRNVSESLISSYGPMSEGDLMTCNHIPVKAHTSQDAIITNATIGKAANRNFSSDSSRSTISTVSGVSFNSKSSWDSLQKSINLTLRSGDDEFEDEQQDADFDWENETNATHTTRSLSSKTASSVTSFSTTSSKESVSNASSDSALDADLEGQKTLPLRISRGPTQVEKKIVPNSSVPIDDISNLEPPSITELSIGSPFSPGQSVVDSVIAGYYDETTQMESELEIESEANVSKSSDGSFNEGAGKRFSFPNTVDNVTNDELLRQSIRNSRQSISSRRSFISHDGHIEIPDLDSLSTARPRDTETINKDYDFEYGENGSEYTNVSTKKSENTIDALEPLGVPSKEAKEFARTLYASGDDTDSDVEDLKKTLYNAINTSSTLESNPYNPVPILVQPSKLSPIRHSRHRSMFNIDFNIKELTLKLTRSKSLPDIPKENKESTEISTEVPAPDSDDLPEQAFVENIVVAEPPPPVTYAIDFKDNQSVQAGQEETFHKTNYDYNEINRTLSKLNNNITSTPRTNGTGSTNSSYQSSLGMNSNSTHTLASDAESVLIDLTQDKVQICHVQRNDTMLSYKSVTEKSKDGKEIEVVLVDDEELAEDDLLSVYSKYRRNWVNRTNSTTSSASTAYSSVASFESGASGKLVVKPGFARDPDATRRSILKNAGMCEPLQVQQLRIPQQQKSIRSYQSMRIQHPRSRSISPTKTSSNMTSDMANRVVTPVNNFSPVKKIIATEKPLPPSPLSSAKSRFEYHNSCDFNTYMQQNN